MGTSNQWSVWCANCTSVKLFKNTALLNNKNNKTMTRHCLGSSCCTHWHKKECWKNQISLKKLDHHSLRAFTACLFLVPGPSASKSLWPKYSETTSRTVNLELVTQWKHPSAMEMKYFSDIRKQPAPQEIKAPPGRAVPDGNRSLPGTGNRQGARLWPGTAPTRRMGTRSLAPREAPNTDCPNQITAFFLFWEGGGVWHAI